MKVAMHLFWERGFEGTSTHALATAMGIQPPSLYAAFGDKRRLFHEVVGAYLQGPGGYAAGALAAPTARQTVEQLLRGAVRAFTTPGQPTGCLVVLGAASGGPECAEVAAALAEQRRGFGEVIRDRLHRGQAEGELPSGVNVSALADYVLVLYQGLALAARDGRSRQELGVVVTQALQAWPGTLP